MRSRLGYATMEILAFERCLLPCSAYYPHDEVCDDDGDGDDDDDDDEDDDGGGGGGEGDGDANTTDGGTPIVREAVVMATMVGMKLLADVPTANLAEEIVGGATEMVMVVMRIVLPMTSKMMLLMMPMIAMTMRTVIMMSMIMFACLSRN